MLLLLLLLSINDVHLSHIARTIVTGAVRSINIILTVLAAAEEAWELAAVA